MTLMVVTRGVFVFMDQYTLSEAASVFFDIGFGIIGFTAVLEPFFEPEITTDEDLMATLTEEEKREFAESSPAPIFRYNEQTRKVEIDAPETCTYDGECLKKAEELGKPGLVDIRAKEDAFLFTVESTGALSPEAIVLNALKVLDAKLEMTKSELDIVKSEMDTAGVE